MSHLSYFGVLVVCATASLSLEYFMRTRVLLRTRRLVMALIPSIIVFSAWDMYAIAREHWTFNPKMMTGIETIGHIPIEEIAFFVVIPLCSILTLEAVRSAWHWKVGDEAGSEL